ncbi:MAG: M23 family metallopeptidase [Candidatus Rokuibacteriota bacterium]
MGDGEQVSQGQVIGYGDDTGNSTGPHLHLEVKYNGQYVDPATVL